MKAFYTDIFALPLPDGHRFPMAKYSRLRQKLLSEKVLHESDLLIPEPATEEQILRCHDTHYVQRVFSGTLSRQEVIRIGFPWSPQLVERSRRSSGATIAAAHRALHDGVGINMAGGTHHAGRDFGGGFSIFNDSAITARDLQASNLAEKVLIIDCDVHQGNGTADICAGDPTIFTFSIHGEKNFPFRKVASNLDIGLPDGTQDDDYLETLDIALERIFAVFAPDFVIYQSGADPFVGDRLGKLSLTREGLARRERLVLDYCSKDGLPVAISMGGGYAESVEDIVDIHLQTIRIAAEYAGSKLSRS